MVKNIYIKIKAFIDTEDKKRLLSNFSSLSILQGANYILPLITLPYLVRVLGPEKFGLIAFAQAFIQYFNIFTDYGFNLSATREISIHRENKEKIAEIFSSVMIIKFALLILSFIIMTIIVFSFEKFRKDWLVYYLTFGMVIGQVLFPIWFFQGLEKMKYITFLNILAKLIFTVAIFVFVRKVSDYIYVPLINSLGFLVSGILAILIIFKKFNLKLVYPGKNVLNKYLKASTQFFLSRAFVSVYTVSNTFIIGLVLGYKIAGYFSAAEKVFNAIIALYQPLVDSLYPLMSKLRDIVLFKKIFKIVIYINSILWLLVFIFSNHIIYILYGKDFEVSSQLLKIFSILGILLVPAILIGYPFLAALGYPKYANYSVIIASILHLILLLIVIPVLNVYLVVILLVFTQLLVLGIRVYGIKKYKLWSN